MVYKVISGNIEKAFECIEKVNMEYDFTLPASNIPYVLKERILLVLPYSIKTSMDKFKYLMKLKTAFTEVGIRIDLSNVVDFMKEYDLVRGEIYINELLKPDSYKI